MTSAHWDKHRWESLRPWYADKQPSFENFITSFSNTSLSAYTNGASIFFQSVLQSSLSTFPDTIFGRSLSSLLTSLLDWRTIHNKIKKEVPREKEERERKKKGSILSQKRITE